MEFEVFEMKPTRKTAPDECQWKTCDVRPEFVVRFADPKGYVCYCKQHRDEAFQLEDAKRILQI